MSEMSRSRNYLNLNNNSFNPLVRDAHYSERLFTKPTIRSQPMINWRIFIFCILGTNGLTAANYVHIFQSLRWEPDGALHLYSLAGVHPVGVGPALHRRGHAPAALHPLRIRTLDRGGALDILNLLQRWLYGLFWYLHEEMKANNLILFRMLNGYVKPNWFCQKNAYRWQEGPTATPEQFATVPLSVWKF